MARPYLVPLLLLVLCGAYLLGGVDKLLDWPGAVRETAATGLPLAWLFTAATVVTELAGPLMVISGRWRGLGAAWLGLFTLAAALLANRFWDLPQGPARFGMTNAFFEHLGLAASFFLLSLTSFPRRTSNP